MSGRTYLFTSTDDGRQVDVMGEADGSTEVLIYRPGACSTRYSVRLNPDELADLAISALGHLRDCGLTVGLLP